MKLSALMKKEFHRFFHDIRLIVTMILPGVLIFLIYSIMGTAIHGGEQTQYHYKVSVYGQSEITSLIGSVVGEENIEYTYTYDIESAKQDVKDGKITALIVFSDNFDDEVKNYSPSSDKAAPQVKIYYLSSSEEGLSFFSIANATLNSFEETLVNKFDVNASKTEKFDLSEASDFGKSLMSGILPFILVALIFSSCMGITLESVAGEKERGTLSTILATSAKRRDIALGKVIALGCISSIGAVSSFLGVALSIPKLIGASVGSLVGGFGFVNYLLMFLLILSVVPFIVAIISLVSTYAKSVKEASAYTSVVMILAMVLSIVSSFVTGIGDWIVAVPILNMVVCMQDIFMLNVSVWQSLVSVVINFAYTGLLIFAISKMLSNEKIMFGS